MTDFSNSEPVDFKTMTLNPRSHDCGGTELQKLTMEFTEADATSLKNRPTYSTDMQP